MVGGLLWGSPREFLGETSLPGLLLRNSKCIEIRS